MNLITLGTLRLEGSDFGRTTPLLLLTYLSLTGRQTRKHLAHLFWQQKRPQTGQQQALNSLSRLLSDLRKHAPGSFEADTISVWTSLKTDVSAFEEACAAKAYRRAIELYQGDFLAHRSPKLGYELEEWLFKRRETLAEQAVTALLALAENRLSRRDQKGALEYAERAWKLRPPVVTLERLHALFEKLGSPLVEEVEALAESYGASLNALSTPAAVPKLPHLPVPTCPTNLPACSTPFVGREGELAKLKRTLSQPQCRLLTLTGLGGVGKSRLAAQLARELLGKKGFEDGTYLVSLEALSDPALVPSSLADTLELPLGQDDPLQHIKAHLTDRAVLLVFDNVEHLLAGTSWLLDLLAHCPRLTLLVTSRVTLNVALEWVYPVEGLALPPEDADPTEAQGAAAVALFVQRAQRARLTFELDEATLPHVLTICRAVEGSPLGLELAAAWVKGTPLADVARSVSDSLDFLRTPTRSSQPRQGQPRHESLEQVFEQSWALLSAAGRKALTKLTVFRGGFCLEAAEAVTGTSLAVLASLVDKSLLRVSGGRYDRHPLVFEFSLKKLEADTEPLQARHARYFLALADRADPHLRGPEQAAWLKRLDADHDNIRHALAWTLGADPELALALTGRLWYYWYIKGHHNEGRSWLEKALCRPTTQALTPDRARALRGVSGLALDQGDYAVAKAHALEAQAIYEAFEDTEGNAATLNLLSCIASYQGDYSAAYQHCQDSLDRYRAVNDLAGASSALANLGIVALDTGEVAKAYALFEEGLQLSRDIGNQRGAAFALDHLSYAALEQGDLEQAHLLCQESLSLRQALNDRAGSAYPLEGLARLSQVKGDFEQAYRHYQESLAIRHDVGDRVGMIVVLENLASLAAEQAQWQQVASLLGRAKVLRQKLGAPLPPAQRRKLERVRSQARAQLDAKTWRSAWRRGRRTPLEQAA